MTPSGRYRRFRAPQGDGEVLCIPSMEQLPALVARNHSESRFAGSEWYGRSLTDLARQARATIIADAVACTRQYSDVSNPPSADQPLIVTGHQPEIFHPGVWLKNFEASRLAKACGGAAINLVIDSDLCRAPSIRVPTGSVAELRTEAVAFDQSLVAVPYEERLIADRSQWESFGSRVSKAIQPLVADPLVQDWWPTMIEASQRNENLGHAISQSRHQLELQWGSRSLELPQSHVCRSEAFRLFAMQLFLRAAEFRKAFNESLAHYRTEHRLKNHAQPVPDLAAHDDWVETPFWIWSTSNPERHGVFARVTGTELQITDRHGFMATLSRDAGSAFEQFAEWEAHRIRLRTRALATTLFARLLIADVFIHGIGGAKYDQVTDEICERFFGVTLPAYATISGTLRLPIEAPIPQPISAHQLRQELREHRFHPEFHQDKMALTAAEFPDVERLVAAKQSWVQSAKTPGNAAERHHAITSVNQQLQSFLNTRKVLLEQQIDAAKLAASTEQLRSSREYAYCLFPQDRLREFLQR